MDASMMSVERCHEGGEPEPANLHVAYKKPFSFDDCTRITQGLPVTIEKKEKKTPNGEDDAKTEGDEDDVASKPVDPEQDSIKASPYELPSQDSMLFQIVLMTICLFCANSCNIIVYGLPFMKIFPQKYDCRYQTNVMKQSANPTYEWKSCSKEEICASGVEYRTDYTDQHFIWNWI